LLFYQTKLFVSGLPKLYTEADVEIRKAELERAFRRYGGAQGVTVICSKNSTFAFVEVETERQTDLALSEMQNKYRINRARRSRHEALMEERALTASGSDVATKATSDWD
jgi:RNA recognition motif-containing protein